MPKGDPAGYLPNVQKARKGGKKPAPTARKGTRPPKGGPAPAGFAAAVSQATGPRRGKR